MITGQWDVEFRRDGAVYDDEQVVALLGGLEGASDLLVVSHGWNNNIEQAKELYDELLERFEVLPQPERGPGSRVAVMRVFWPSKKFTPEDLIPGGGVASAGDSTGEEDAAVRAIEVLRTDPLVLGGEDTEPVAAPDLDRAAELVPQLEFSATARRDFVLSIRSALNPDEAHPDDATAEFFSADPEELFRAFELPAPLVPPTGQGGGTANLSIGGLPSLGDMFTGPRAAARRIANFATYYRMKTRAGTVGRGGVAATLLRIRQQHPELPIHLVGHSFGGRLVVAAASSLPGGKVPVTLTLLQAAFSHNGLAPMFDGEHDGAFRRVVQVPTVTGPIVITHTKHDTAVGIAYPLASRIARDTLAALGDQDDPYGGMGRNGAQNTPEVDDGEQSVRTELYSYRFAPGKVYNLNADGAVRDHSDVKGIPIANVILSNMTAGGDWVPTPAV